MREFHSHVCVLRDEDASSPANAAGALAKRLDLPLRGSDAIEPDDIVVVAAASGLELRSGDALDRAGVRVDFNARAIHPRTRARAGHASADQPLRRAIGRRVGRVVDATAGFGDDTCLLASFGHQVIAIERSPVVAALLEDGLARAHADPALAEAAGRVRVVAGDSIDLLAGLRPPPDTVYIDPMYPNERRKRALPRRSIQLLRALVGDDEDAKSLFDAARATGAARIVVKRPHRAEPLGGKPSHSHSGKLVRYDVYRFNPAQSGSG